jgi:hypothetical protein
MAQLLCVMALLCGCVFSQTTTGTVTGTVTDPGDAAVPGAQVELKNTATGAVLTTATGAEGIFRFNSLVPATYSLTVKPAAGFKTYTQTAIEVTANETRDLGKIPLALGALSEQVSVTAITTPIQTASSENSKLIDTGQMMDITLKGRDLFGMLVMLPGMATAQQDTTSENSIGSVRVNGGNTGLANFTVDGITDTDTANNTTLHFEPNMDSIAEMRVLTTNYQAEYGRNSSGQISVVTKGGSQEFHGSAWTNKRHEMFNAHSWFQNYVGGNKNAGGQKSLYRFFIYGFSVGGPVYIPKLFNTEKKKLFFFFSQEYTKQRPATQESYYNMPTTAQRAGNFAGYVDGNGVAFPINDPSTGLAVPNQNISGLVLNSAAAKAGQAMLNFFPLPNICGHVGVDPSNCITDGTYATTQWGRNYYERYNETHPRRNDTLRIDYNVTSKLNSWVRYINDYDLDTTSFGSNTSPVIALKNAAGQASPMAVDHPNPGHGYGVGITYTISPTMVNEFTFGKSYNTWSYYVHDQTQLDRARMGNPPSFNNFTTDPLFVNDLQSQRLAGLGTGSIFYQTGVPNLSFGGNESGEVSMTPNCGGAQCPYSNWNDIYSFNDAVSKVWGKHNIKAGMFYERTGKVEVGSGSQGSYLGAYNFSGTNAAMPNNTNDGYANAFLGNFQNYSEGGRAVVDAWYSDLEFFIQDNWRVSRRVTLDLGIRFTHQVPTENLNPNTYDFIKSSYNAAQAERLYYPTCLVSTAKAACPTASNRAYDPVTNTTTFAALQGTFVPFAVGGYSTTPTPFPGMESFATGSKNGLDTWTYTSGLVPSIRLGVAWDVFGNGKTAIRAGFGQFVNLTDSHFAQLSSGNPPNTVNRNIYYASVDQVPTFANTAAITPISPQGTVGPQKMQGNYNGSFMIQQNIGWGTVLEASYVFNLSKHMWAQYQLNAVAPYSQYNPANNNPNVAYLPANTNGKPLSDNYFRPMAGLGAPVYNSLAENSAYNSLQVTVRRNMTRHLSYGLAYTWSKIMSTGGNYPQTVSPYFADKFRNYGPSYSPSPQTAAVNYVYEAPNLGQKLNFKPLGWVTDHWVVSGITQIRANMRAAVPGISFTNTTNANPQMNWTGGYEGARMVVTGDPALPAGQESFAGNTTLVAAPGANANGSPGNQLLNESVFVIPMPCSWTPGATPQQGIGQSMSCYGNAGPGSLIPIPHTRTFNWDMTFSKSFPLKSEKRAIMFRAEMYNIFNHTQFNNYNITPSYNWPLWQNGVLQQTNVNLGRYTAAQNPRQMSMSLRFQF